MGVYPITVQSRIQLPPMKDVIKWYPNGNRNYSKLDKTALKKLLREK